MKTEERAGAGSESMSNAERVGEPMDKKLEGVKELYRAVFCLNLAVEPSIANDVKKQADTAFAEIREELRKLRQLVEASRDGFLDGEPYILTYSDIISELQAIEESCRP